MTADSSNLIRAIRDAAARRGIVVVATCAAPEYVELEWDWPVDSTCSWASWPIDEGERVLKKIEALPAGPFGAAKVNKILRGAI